MASSGTYRETDAPGSYSPDIPSGQIIPQIRAAPKAQPSLRAPTQRSLAGACQTAQFVVYWKQSRLPPIERRFAGALRANDRDFRMDRIRPGLTGEKTVTVSEEQLASHLGSGSIEVFATPAMIALPIKLLLFVLADGWRLVAQTLVASFGMG